MTGPNINDMAWAETFSERSLELRADLDGGDIRFAVRTSRGVAVRSWSPDADRFAAATLAPDDVVGTVAGDLLRDTGEFWFAQRAGAVAGPPAPDLADLDTGVIARSVHAALRGYEAGVRERGAGRSRAVVRIRLRHHRLTDTDGTDASGTGVHVHVFGEAFHDRAMGASGLAVSSLADLTVEACHELGNLVGAQAVRLSDAHRPRSTRCAAVFAPVAAGVLIHEVVGHSLEADAAPGAALWRLRERPLGPASLTVYDDGRSPQAWERVDTDEEGTALRRTDLVAGGMVVGLATDRAAARRLGHERSSGHGRRGGYAHRPAARVRHTVVADGTDAPAAIVADTTHGVLIEAVEAGEADIRDGRFTIRVREGRRIDAGRTGDVLTDFTVTGSLADFGRLDAIGDDGGRGHALCGRGSHWLPISTVTPTLRLPDVDLHGAP